jgi:exonuclease III
LITWNVARRVRGLPEQVAALAGREPDVVALQEVSPATLPLWRHGLARIGLPHVLCSLDTADPRREPARTRGWGVLVAAREALRAAPRLPVPREESTLAAALPDGVVVHTVHVPNAANGWVKVETLLAVRAGLAARPPGQPTVLCGDLNTPRRETPDGEVLTFGQDTHGRVRPERGEAWDAGERAVVPGLREVGFTDAFRALHGAAARAASWTYPRGGGGYRIDHLFVAGLAPRACAYHHAWREAGLSDHSALEADVEP